MCYGIDSGSKRTLAFIRKNIDRGILYQRVRETTDQGIVPTLSYVIGFPEEEKEDIDATLKLALRTAILGNVNTLIQLPTVLPGTDLHLSYAGSLVREVDTYFSLGLEFDHDKRLESDEHMINADPLTFSSFYNLACPGRSLKELCQIADYFPIIANCYPMSFLLLGLECGRSLSDLFLNWLAWLSSKIPKKELTLTLQNCHHHFSSFAHALLEEREATAREYIFDILKYETLVLQVGEGGGTGNTFTINTARLGDLRPVRNDRMVVEEFSFNMPEIIANLKAGMFGRSYMKKPTILLFRHERDHLNISEINTFGRDLLNLCDGTASMHFIAEKLYPLHGAQMESGEFFDACARAIEVLKQMNLLRAKHVPAISADKLAVLDPPEQVEKEEDEETSC
jgi:hypothetical protein